MQLFINAFSDSICTSIERFNDNERWLTRNKGCGSDRDWPSLKYYAGRNIMPTSGTVTCAGVSCIVCCAVGVAYVGKRENGWSIFRMEC